MKYFKIKASRMAERYEVNSNEFTRHTDNKFPYVQSVSENKIAQYGICPSCLNPIQLIGLNKKISCSPYGKHAGKDVAGLPKWNPDKYLYCPFSKSNDRREPAENELIEITEDVIELYELLKSQFDRVIYVIKTELMIDCSTAFWEKALQQFVNSNGYCYPWLTESNLPYIFTYIGMQHSKLFMQKFKEGTELYNALDKQDNTKFVPITDKDGNELEKSEYKRLINDQYMNYQFRFTAHRQNAADGSTLEEKMDFCIDDMRTNTEIYRRTIIFDENYFMNIVKKTGNEKYRAKNLLDIAEKIMTSITIQN